MTWLIWTSSLLATFIVWSQLFLRWKRPWWGTTLVYLGILAAIIFVVTMPVLRWDNYNF